MTLAWGTFLTLLPYPIVLKKKHPNSLPTVKRCLQADLNSSKQRFWRPVWGLKRTPASHSSNQKPSFRAPSGAAQASFDLCFRGSSNPILFYMISALLTVPSCNLHHSGKKKMQGDRKLPQRSAVSRFGTGAVRFWRRAVRSITRACDSGYCCPRSPSSQCLSGTRFLCPSNRPSSTATSTMRMPRASIAPESFVMSPGASLAALPLITPTARCWSPIP
jgi:hypothetical protein